MKRREYLTNIGKIRKSNNSIKHTFATTFLLPTIGYCEKEFKDNLINVHIGEDFNEPILYIIIDYDPNMDESFNRLKSNNIYQDHIFSECKTEVIIKFKIPIKYHNIFNKYINGNYSGFTNEYKQILTKLYGNKVNQDGRLVSVYDIIYPRTEKLKQIANNLDVDISVLPREVFDKPDLDYEIYKPLQQLIQQLEIHGTEERS